MEDLVTIFRSGDPGRFGLAQSLLEREHIEFAVKGEEVQGLFGAGVLGTGFNEITGGAELVVRAADADRARSLLADLQ